MQFLIDWRMKALKQLRKFPQDEQKKINEKVSELQNSEEWGDVTRLTDHKFDCRLRVGNYRILFNIEKELKILSIEEVKKRDEKTY